LLAASAAALALTLGTPVAAQQSGGTFSLPPSRPSPTPAPAGPADERAGVAIPPRAVPTARPTATPTPAPTAAPTVAPTATPTIPPRAVIDAAPTPRTAASPAPSPTRERAPQAGASAPSVAQPLPSPSPEASPEAGGVPAFPSAPAPEAAAPSQAPAPSLAPATASDPLAALPQWWPYAAGGLGAAVLLGLGGWLAMRRRKPKVLRLAAHPAAASASEPEALPDLSDLHLILDVTSATRSIMMFTLGYRLTISNRSGRAVGNVTSAVELVCARASAGRGPSAGAAQALGGIERIGPHQARSISGEVQLPLSAIQPLRQGTKPVFVPLVHVTLEAEGLPAITKSFVVGPRSPSGRVHPIGLDQGPGGIAGLVAQAIAAPPASAAA
jgi:hypothetical protein